MIDPALRAAAAVDFRLVRGQAPYVSRLPLGRTQPLGLPDHMVKTGQDELFASSG
ncbi:hypothetical protein [Rhodovulum sp. 12E13]|uniref:hypothetical protein n=1 Tax=Rhodovulum sp. 12E13 TaxID=2203891 RepID=UPI0018F661A9|nr:hypothetical protein [Rhodovulum sp. 12E13]